MPTELEIIYILLGGQAIGMLLLTAYYYIMRLRLEGRKVAIEEQKLKIRQENGP